MAEVPMNRQELRDRVVEVASKAFREKGVKSVTMDEVAHLLTMSKRTLYQLFADKEDLLLACLEADAREEDAFLKALGERTDNVMEVILAVFEGRMRAYGQLSLALLPDVKKYPRIMELIKKRKRHGQNCGVAFLNKGIEQGIFRPDIDFQIVFSFMQHNLDFVISNEAFGDYQLQEIFSNTVLVVMRGCTTAKGLQLLDEFMEKWRPGCTADAPGE